MTMSALIEKRRGERFPVRIDVDCEGYSSRIVAQITDLSLQGAYLDTINPFPVGADLEMRFAGRSETARIHARGVVRHLHGGLGMGVEFQDAGRDFTEELDKILHRYVLIVDDDETYRTFLRLLFEKRGYRVRTAKDGQEAQELASREAFDLVLTDGLMPHMHGFELSRIIKALPNCRRTKVIVMTAVYKSELYRLEATHKFNADAFLRKPFKIEELLEKVDALLES